MASWARLRGRKPYDDGWKSASKIGSSTNFSDACTIRSAIVGIPNQRTLPLLLGIDFCRTRSGTNLPAFTVSRRSASMVVARAEVIDRGAIWSTPAVRAPLLVRTRSHAAARKAGS